jgi:magnesium transporter
MRVMKVGTLFKRFVARLQEPVPVPVRADTGAVTDCAVYVGGARQPGRPDYADALSRARKRRGGFVWLGLFDPTEAQLAPVVDVFGIPDAVTERVGTAGRRPTVERIGDFTLLTVRTVRYHEHDELTETSEVVDTGEVTLILGRQFVISVRRGGPGALAEVRAGLERRPSVLGHGPWSVAYAVCERMVQLYHDVAARVEEDVERVEQTAFLRQGASDMQQMYQLKREILEFKRAVAPMRDPVRSMVEPQFGAPAELRQYLRDVDARLHQAVERISGFNELLDSILQARLAQVGIDQNNDMRKIAAWAAIAALQTAIAGIYGMNFDNMPELHWRYGYWGVIALMVLGAVGLHRLFRRSGWL